MHTTVHFVLQFPGLTVIPTVVLFLAEVEDVLVLNDDATDAATWYGTCGKSRNDSIPLSSYWSQS
jgi:hypothetical protein